MKQNMRGEITKKYYVQVETKMNYKIFHQPYQGVFLDLSYIYILFFQSFFTEINGIFLFYFKNSFFLFKENQYNLSCLFALGYFV